MTNDGNKTETAERKQPALRCTPSAPHSGMRDDADEAGFCNVSTFAWRPRRWGSDYAYSPANQKQLPPSKCNDSQRKLMTKGRLCAPFYSSWVTQTAERAPF
jgi:hypothetical protein